MNTGAETLYCLSVTVCRRHIYYDKAFSVHFGRFQFSYVLTVYCESNGIRIAFLDLIIFTVNTFYNVLE